MTTTDFDITTPDRVVPPTLDDLATALERSLVRTLPDAGLDRMTRSGIESALCSSALTAHI